MHVCYQGGFLVSASYPVPTDPTDYHFHGLPKVGCSRIRCRLCRMRVRNLPNRWFVSPKDTYDPVALYETEDLAGSPLLGNRPQSRMYICRCQRWLEAYDQPLVDPDPDLQSARLPWQCEGHPAAEPPCDIDGAHVANEKALIDIVLRSLHGEYPPGTRAEDRQRAFFAARTYCRVAGTPPADPVVQAVVARLEDPVVEVRARALQFFFTLGLPAGAQRATALLEGDRRLFADVPDPITKVYGDTTLEDALWRVALPAARSSARLRELARAEAVMTGKGRMGVYDVLATYDPAWLAEHAEQVARATPALRDRLIILIGGRFPVEVPAKPIIDKLKALALPKA